MPVFHFTVKILDSTHRYVAREDSYSVESVNQEEATETLKKQFEMSGIDSIRCDSFHIKVIVLGINNFGKQDIRLYSFNVNPYEYENRVHINRAIEDSENNRFDPIFCFDEMDEISHSILDLSQFLKINQNVKIIDTKKLF